MAVLDPSKRFAPCPCCGRPFDDGWTIEEQIVAARLTPMQAEIVRILARAKGKWITASRIAEELYSLDPNGGPDDGRNTVAVHMHNIRRKTEAFAIEGISGVGIRLTMKIECSGTNMNTRHRLTEQGKQW